MWNDSMGYKTDSSHGVYEKYVINGIYFELIKHAGIIQYQHYNCTTCVKIGGWEKK